VALFLTLRTCDVQSALNLLLLIVKALKAENLTIQDTIEMIGQVGKNLFTVTRVHAI